MICLLFTVAAMAQDPVTPATPPAEPEPVADVGQRDSFALSGGTGPLPLNTLSLGATGLGTRVYLGPMAGLRPYANLAWTHGSVSSWERDRRDERYISSGRTVALSLGARRDLSSDGVVVPYAQSGVLIANAGTRDRQKGDGDPYRARGTLLGALVGLGTDGFVVPGHVSIGLELGALAASGGGTNGGKETIGDDKSAGVLISTYASVQATVWR